MSTHRRFAALSLLAGILLTPRAEAAESCARYLAPERMNQRIDAFDRQTGFDFSSLTTEASLETFYAGGLPRLAEIARRGGGSIARVVEDQFAVFHLGVESDDSLDADLTRDNLDFLKDLNGAFHNLESTLADGHPTEANAGQLARAEIFLRMVSFGLALSQLERGDAEILNPFADFDAEHVDALMLAIEDGAFENILDSFAPPEPAPPPAPPAGAPAPEAIAAPARVETDLARVLKLDLAFDPALTYSARTARDVTYNVRVTKAVAKEMRGRQRQSVHRLMRALFTGRGHSSGLKNLIEVGPDVVELKTVMNGHLRIIGCLDGRNLRLMKVIDIKDSVATYSRRIPANFCK